MKRRDTVVDSFPVNNKPGGSTTVRAIVSGMACLAAFALPMTINQAQAQEPSVIVTSTSSTLSVREAVPGSMPRPESDNATRLTLNATAGSSRLLVHTESPLPFGVVLSVHVQAPAGAMNLGYITLDTTPHEALREIPAGLHTGLIVTYEITATASAGTLPLSSCSVVFTLENGL